MGTASDEDFSAYAAGRWPSLVRSAVLLGCSYADAEDAAQVALMRTWSRWGRVQRAAEPDAYVYRILVNGLATSRRRRWWGERPTEHLPDDGSADHTEAVELRHALVDALRRLPTDQREALVLRFVGDLSERATAEVLGVAIGTVKSRTSRAIAAVDLSRLNDFMKDER